MIAGGTGITPMLQVMQEVARNPEDKTKVTLVFAMLPKTRVNRKSGNGGELTLEDRTFTLKLLFCSLF